MWLATGQPKRECRELTPKWPIIYPPPINLLKNYCCLQVPECHQHQNCHPHTQCGVATTMKTSCMSMILRFIGHFLFAQDSRKVLVFSIQISPSLFFFHPEDLMPHTETKPPLFLMYSTDPLTNMHQTFLPACWAATSILKVLQKTLHLLISQAFAIKQTGIFLERWKPRVITNPIFLIYKHILHIISIKKLTFPGWAM